MPLDEFDNGFLINIHQRYASIYFVKLPISTRMYLWPLDDAGRISSTKSSAQPLKGHGLIIVFSSLEGTC